MAEKVKKAEFKFGKYTVDAYLHPSGDYSFGYDFLANVAEKDKSILSDKKSPYHLKALTGKGKFTQSVKVNGIGYTYKSVSMDGIGNALGALANLGHQEATALLVASFQESLERRADRAFEISRSEEERDRRLQLAIDHAKQFHSIYTIWLKNDNPDRKDYGTQVNNLKRSLGLPLISIELYNLEQQSKMNTGEAVYDTLRKVGFSHTEALNKL